MRFTNCCGKSCSANDCCANCHNWTDEKWEKVASAYHNKLVIQWGKRRRGRQSFPPLLFQAFLHPVSYLFPYLKCKVAHLIMQ